MVLLASSGDEVKLTVPSEKIVTPKEGDKHAGVQCVECESLISLLQGNSHFDQSFAGQDVLDAVRLHYIEVVDE